MNINELINNLLGLTYPDIKSGDPLPSYLSKKYSREGAAIRLKELNNNAPEIIGALCKACLTDEEEDVRLAALEALAVIDRKISISIAHMLLEDEEDSVQLAARDLTNT